MSPDDPRHGSIAGATAHWVDGEPTCKPCRDAKTREHKRAQWERLQGNPRTITIDPDLYESITSIPMSELVAASGIKSQVLVRIIDAGPNGIIHRRTRDKLTRAVLGAQRWTAVGLRRRVGALNCLGWTDKQIAVEAGVSTNSIRALRNATTYQHRREFALAVIDAYERLSIMLPPITGPRGQEWATKARNRATALGYLPPLAWDDIDNDERPNVGSESANDERRRELVDEWHWLMRQGESQETAAARLGLSVTSLKQYRSSTRDGAA